MKATMKPQKRQKLEQIEATYKAKEAVLQHQKRQKLEQIEASYKAKEAVLQHWKRQRLEQIEAAHKAKEAVLQHQKRQKLEQIEAHKAKEAVLQKAIVSKHVTQKPGMLRKKYHTQEKAQKAILLYETTNSEDTNSGILKKSIPRKEISLGPNMGKRLVNIKAQTARSKILSIPTTEEKTQKLITKEIFYKNLDLLINYGDIHTTMGFYPKAPKTTYTAPKAIAIEEIDPLLCYQFFCCGLLKTIYLSKLDPVTHFPKRFQRAVSEYLNYAVGREVFIDIVSSTLPVFKEDVVLPSIAVMRIGMSSRNYPTRDVIIPEVAKIDDASIAHSLANTYLESLRIEPPKYYRVNYWGSLGVMYSSNKEHLSEKGHAALKKFQEPFNNFSGQLSKYPEEIKKKLCEYLEDFQDHCCELCPCD